jgi:hypothetical protein
MLVVEVVVAQLMEQLQLLEDQGVVVLVLHLLFLVFQGLQILVGVVEVLAVHLLDRMLAVMAVLVS